MIRYLTLLAVCISTVLPIVAQNQPLVPAEQGLLVTLWPQGKIPGKVSELPDQPPAGGDRRKVDGMNNVSNPDLIVYPAKQSAGPAPAIVVCPGGGYGHLAYKKEGTEIAAWLNSMGITALVLKYRVPGNRDGAFADIERAVRLARKNAGAWKLNPNKLGVMGFSAGGHLCARLSTSFDKDGYAPIDEADKLSCRPDFCVLVYPAYLNRGTALAPELTVSAKTPPTLIIHNEDDPGFAAGSKIYAAALQAAGVPHEFIFYKTGGHGYGLRSDKDVKAWPDACKLWLTKRGVL
ncbi:MAG TPA: alpha/beta hydrolase [Rariglobus sp.]|jgi:acetyl esterase/lipase|nr:alpha/beta hydrolase [Rariglobus sp.]